MPTTLVLLLYLVWKGTIRALVITKDLLMKQYVQTMAGSLMNTIIRASFEDATHVHFMIQVPGVTDEGMQLIGIYPFLSAGNKYVTFEGSCVAPLL